MARQRFYVVTRGRTVGIYDSWFAARVSVEGFQSALHKSFSTLELAELWWRDHGGAEPVYHFDPKSLKDQIEGDLAEVDESCFVYLICNPQNKRPFYVGETRNFERRKKNHLRASQGAGCLSKVERKIRELLNEGVEPVFEIVAQGVTKAEALQIETAWVKKLSAEGVTLMNSWREHREWIERLQPTAGTPR